MALFLPLGPPLSGPPPMGPPMGPRGEPASALHPQRHGTLPWRTRGLGLLAGPWAGWAGLLKLDLA